MRHAWTAKLWIESWLAAAAGVLFVATLISAEWIELVFGVDPDGGSGVLEWAIAGGLLCAAIVAGALARLEWRHVVATGEGV